MYRALDAGPMNSDVADRGCMFLDTGGKASGMFMRARRLGGDMDVLSEQALITEAVNPAKAVEVFGLAPPPASLLALQRAAPRLPSIQTQRDPKVQVADFIIPRAVRRTSGALVQDWGEKLHCQAGRHGGWVIA